MAPIQDVAQFVTILRFQVIFNSNCIELTFIVIAAANYDDNDGYDDDDDDNDAPPQKFLEEMQYKCTLMILYNNTYTGGPPGPAAGLAGVG